MIRERVRGEEREREREREREKEREREEKERERGGEGERGIERQQKYVFDVDSTGEKANSNLSELKMRERKKKFERGLECWTMCQHCKTFFRRHRRS
jgi:hypothetical protein